MPTQLPVAPNDESAITDKIVDLVTGPIGQNFGLGALTGACAGYTTKRVSKEAAYYVGGAFIFLQLLAYKGYISINYKKVAGDVEAKLDRNGDGKFDASDAKALLSDFLQIVRQGVPSGAGFLTGFYYGLKWY